MGRSEKYTKGKGNKNKAVMQPVKKKPSLPWETP